MDYRNLSIALIFLAVLLTILVGGYLVNRYFPRNRSPCVELENAPSPSPHHRTRPEIRHEYHGEEQRLSSLTTVAPSIELVPKARPSTIKHHTQGCLEQRDGLLLNSDTHAAPYKAIGATKESAQKRKWRYENKNVSDSSDEDKGSNQADNRKKEDGIVQPKCVGAMELFRLEDTLQVDTHAAPKGPFPTSVEPWNSVFFDDYTSRPRGGHATHSSDAIVVSTTTTESPAATTTVESLGRISSEGARPAIGAGTVILCIILGVILIVAGILLVLIACIKRKRRKSKGYNTSGHTSRVRMSTKRTGGGLQGL
ncbi:hypothetical protein ACEQ8H_000813 [Pleosporales sp. CAS-2024a]